VIITSKIETPLGIMTAGAVEQGICLLEFDDNRLTTSEFGFLSEKLKTNIEEGNSVHFDNLKQQLKEYFEGRRNQFSIPVVIIGTKFQEVIWKELLNIAYGTTLSYKSFAGALGRSNAVRAVARAMDRTELLL